MNIDKEALKLIDRLYKDLYLSEDVLHYSNSNETDKYNNLKKYLQALEHTHNLVIETGRHIELLKKNY